MVGVGAAYALQPGSMDLALKLMHRFVEKPQFCQSFATSIAGTADGALGFIGIDAIQALLKVSAPEIVLRDESRYGINGQTESEISEQVMLARMFDCQYGYHFNERSALSEAFIRRFGQALVVAGNPPNVMEGNIEMIGWAVAFAVDPGHEGLKDQVRAVFREKPLLMGEFAALQPMIMMDTIQAMPFQSQGNDFKGLLYHLKRRNVILQSRQNPSGKMTRTEVFLRRLLHQDELNQIIS
ncbi:MAG: hypothetical protein KKF07_07070 [Candidatus Margulisbacteria bacterium]|nr:hypothetical protein [Candidatus Margulisiibacteriota bacterium]MBU1729067.1 hypothetical protein [Candidatus Margulisiibacteriota bacterium]MBU1954512.1 hypothetical protein [Candidatus Margulisiibacteriota bacterium]